jgi:hypothetical protein
MSYVASIWVQESGMPVQQNVMNRYSDLITFVSVDLPLSLRLQVLT